MKRLISTLALATVGILFAGCTDALVEAHDEALPTCTMAGADAHGDIITSADGVTTALKKEGDKLTLQCEGASVTNRSERAQAYTGFLCAIASPHDGALRFTYDSHGIVSANGEGTLTCTVEIAGSVHAGSEEPHSHKTQTHWFGHGRP